MSDQSGNCIFCSIVAGRIPASFVYRDALVSAFLDLHPINSGHLLVIPNRHSELVTEMTDAEAGAVFITARKIVQALKSSEIKCEAANLVLSDGKTAGQEVAHSHLHVIPRFIGDGQRLGFKHSEAQSREQLDRAAKEISAKLRGVP